VDKLSSSLTYLSLGDSFNHPIDNLPSSLTHLSLGNDFEHPVDLRDTMSRFILVNKITRKKSGNEF
jgi:FNIP Repeat